MYHVHLYAIYTISLLSKLCWLLVYGVAFQRVPVSQHRMFFTLWSITTTPNFEHVSLLEILFTFLRYCVSEVFKLWPIMTSKWPLTFIKNWEIIYPSSAFNVNYESKVTATFACRDIFILQALESSDDHWPQWKTKGSSTHHGLPTMKLEHLFFLEKPCLQPKVLHTHMVHAQLPSHRLTACLWHDKRWNQQVNPLPHFINQDDKCQIRNCY